MSTIDIAPLFAGNHLSTKPLIAIDRADRVHMAFGELNSANALLFVRYRTWR